MSTFSFGIAYYKMIDSEIGYFRISAFSRKFLLSWNKIN
jgi:hypothetical protein